MRYSFCPKCGGRLVEKIVDGLSRPVCVDCDFVFYQNPPVQSVVVAVKQGKVLAITWGDGKKFALPAGFVEENEEAMQGAKRELYEETGLSCKKLSLLEVSNRLVSSEGMKLPAVSVYFKAEDVEGELNPRENHLKAMWLDLNDLPLESVFYPDDRNVIRKLKELK